MIDKPVINNFEDVSENLEESPEETTSAYDYNDNLTAKLGGNYAKIIEFYESRL
jgi:hypothetical protein